MDINTILTNALTGIGIALIGLVGAYLTLLIRKASERIKAQTKLIKDEATRNLVNNALDKTKEVVNKNVASASETIVKELKASTLDGKLTKEDGQVILGVVKGRVLTQLSDDIKGLASSEIGDIESYVETLIENSLKELKSQNVATTTIDDTVK